MARRLRVEYPGAIYHVMNRGDRREAIRRAILAGAPGAIEIERTKHEAGDYAKTWAGVTPLGRVGQPVDVGRVVVALAGEAGDFVSGQTIWVDGGLFSRPVWPY